MMGTEKPGQNKLYYIHFNIDQRVPADHALRKIAELIDFDFIYDEVRTTYGNNGNVSVPPPVILKLMLLLVLYNVRSERELMNTLPYRLDWLWFLGYDLDSEVPNHSVLSKARSRWGLELFRRFFERIVWQCVEAGLVDSSKVFVDSSLVDADASCNSIVDTHSLKRHLRCNYTKLEERLEHPKQPSGPRARGRIVNNRYVSTTDPDASIVRRGSRKLAYAVHRSVEESNEVITATVTTPGDVNEAHMLEEILDSHQCITGSAAKCVVADSKYGTNNNYLLCTRRGIASHMRPLCSTTEKHRAASGKFNAKEFSYDAEADEYICPAGQRLRRSRADHKRQTHYYRADAGVCRDCSLRNRCTDAKSGRQLSRHFHQPDLDKALECSRTSAAKRDIIKRQSLMERSFARGTRYGYKRSRWRRLWRASIHQYLVSTVQNIQILLKKGYPPPGVPAAAAMEAVGMRNPGWLDMLGERLIVVVQRLYASLNVFIFQLATMTGFSCRLSVVSYAKT